MKNHRKTLLANKIISAITAGSIIFQPITAMAEIIKPNDNGTIIKKDNVTQIYADQLVADKDVALNVFSQFNLDTNKIANMYFSTQPGGTEANNLVNFVNSRIDINGTVNAVKNNTIGGNLYFLSKDGMAVGASGVINAGSLSVMTPKADFYDSLLNSNKNGVNLDNFNKNWNDIQTASIPINASGTITVNGKINTADGIALKAATIQTGNGATLRSDITDFSSLVNIENTNASLGNSLVATQTDGKGDIILAAEADELNGKDEDFPTNHTDGNNLINASVSIADSTINARGDVKITATAENNKELEEALSKEITVADNYKLGQIIHSNADINIDSSDITAEHIDVQAIAKSNYISSSSDDFNVDNIIDGAIELFEPNEEVAYSVLKNTSAVTIGEDANLTANAETEEDKTALNILADSTLNTITGASTADFKFVNAGGTQLLMPIAGAAAWSQADNSATVDIKGKLTSKGNTNIAANATATINTAAVNSTASRMNQPLTPVNISFAYTESSNNSTVNLADSAVINSSGNLNIAANTTNSIDTESVASGRETTNGAVAINYTKHDSNATVNSAASINGDADVTIAANNNTTKNHVLSTANVGDEFIKSIVKKVLKNLEKIDTIKNLENFVDNKVKNKITSYNDTSDKIKDLASIGSSIVVADENNTATVNAGKSIKAGNSLNINADNSMSDTFIKADGLSSNRTEQNNALVSASVVVADIDNTASVLLNDSARLEADTVNINSNSKFNYDRVDTLIEEFLKFTDSIEDFKDAQLTQLVGRAAGDCLIYQGHKRQYESSHPSENYAETSEGNAELAKLTDDFNAISDVLWDADESTIDNLTALIPGYGVFNVLETSFEFSSPASYANFYAISQAPGQSGSSKLSAAGSATAVLLNNNSEVILGKNTAITGTANDVNINSTVKQTAVEMTGKILQNTTGDIAVGGNLNMLIGSSNSMIVAAEGTNISSNGNININSQNDTEHTSIAFGAGISQDAGLIGMASVLFGDSNSLISIDDETSLDAQKDISITSNNDTTISSVAGGAVYTGALAGVDGSAASIDYDINSITSLADNDNASDDTADKVKNLIKNNTSLTAEQLSSAMGKSNTTVSDSGITAQSLAVEALSDGMINSAAVAGSATYSKNETAPLDTKDESVKKADEELKKASDEVNKTGDKVDETANSDEIKKDSQGGTNSKIEEDIKKEETGSDTEKNTATTELTNDNGSKDGNTGKDDTQLNEAEMQKAPVISLTAAGSVAVNNINRETSSTINGMAINLSDNNDSKLTNKAQDDSFAGSWSGAAAASWKQSIKNVQGNTALNSTLAGAAAVNITDSTVNATIESSKINNATSIENTATKSSGLGTLGLGVSLAKTSSTESANANLAASTSVSISNNDTSAIMKDNTVDNNSNVETALINHAESNDVQVTGGINTSDTIAGNNTGLAAGGSVAVADIQNNIKSSIDGGTYNNMSDVTADGVTDITQVNTAVGTSVTVGSGEKVSIGLQGEVAYSKLNNTIDTSISGATISSNGTVSVNASDANLNNSTKKQEYTDYMEAIGVNASGSQYISDTNTVLTNSGQDDVDQIDQSGGNVIVTGAIGVAAQETSSNMSATSTAAISVSDIDNKTSAVIDNNSNITSATTSVASGANTVMVGIGSGAAVGTRGFGGAGSVTWQNLNNDVTSAINDSTVDSSAVGVDAFSQSHTVNVTGQIGVGKIAAGMAMAFNDIGNNTNATVTNSTIGNNTDNTALFVNATNKNKTYGIGLGVAIGTGKFAANGLITINRGNNNIESLVDNSTVKNAQTINILSTDGSESLAIAGSANGSGGVAMGGSVAYNEIGNITAGNDEDKVQNNSAQLNNSTITTANNAEINISATDDANLQAIAAAAGGAQYVAVEGAASTNVINKTVDASMNNTNIDKDFSNIRTDITLTAQNTSNIVSSSTTIAGSGSAAVGASVSANQIHQNANAVVNGGTIKAGNLNLEADTSPSILNISIGGAGAAYGGVAGSVSTNLIDNNAKAHIGDGANITLEGNAGIIAKSDDDITNEAGLASTSVSGGSVGLSVSYNEISGNTEASVGDADEAKVSLTAKGNLNDDIIAVDSKVTNDEVSKEFELGKVDVERQYDEDRKGIVVDASSTHAMKSNIANISGSMYAGIAGNANVNKTGGSTTASITNTLINKDSNNAGDVSVKAGDYTKSQAITGTGGVAIEGAGIGVASENALVNRSTIAEINSSTVNSDKLSVDAISKQGIFSTDVGMSVGAIGAGASGIVSYSELDALTKASIVDTDVNKATSIDVNADHYAKTTIVPVSAGFSGLGGGVGLTVGVVQDDTQTQAFIGSSNNDGDKTYSLNAEGDVNVKANNLADIAPSLQSVGAGAIVGISGTTLVNNFNSVVTADIDHANITAKNITADSHNKYSVNAYAGTVGGGIGGFGAGVVVNTIDSTVQTNVNDSKLDAKEDISLTAAEERDISQIATNATVGGVTAGANIVVSNVGKEVSNIETTDVNGNKTTIDVIGKIDEANNAYGDTNILDYTMGGLESAGLTDKNAIKVNAGKGGGKDNQITVNISNSTVSAGKDFTAKATETDDIKMTAGSGTAGLVGLIGGVGVLDVARNVGVNIQNNTSIDADTIDIATDVTGDAQMNVYQGAAGAITVNSAYAGSSSEGSSYINLSGTKLTGDDINIAAGDHSSVSTDSMGVTVAAAALGDTVSNSSNESDVQVSIDNTTVKEKTADKGTLSVSADKANNVTAHATGGTGVIAGGTGVVALATDSGNAKVILGTGNNFAGNTLNTSAKISSAVKAAADNVTVALLESFNASVAKASLTGESAVTSADNNTLAYDTVNISAGTTSQKDKNNVEATVAGNSGSLAAGVAESSAEATADIKTTIDLGKTNYKTADNDVITDYKWVETKDADGNSTFEQQAQHKTVTTGVTSLNVTGENALKLVADSRGVTVGVGVSSGNYQAIGNNHSSVNINLAGGTDSDTLLGNLDVSAQNNSDSYITSNGDGGALINTGMPAYTENNTVTDSNITVSGNWDIDGDLSLAAGKNDVVDVNADSDAISGASFTGSSTKSNIEGTSKVAVNNATMTVGGTSDIAATNTVDFGKRETYGLDSYSDGLLANVDIISFDNTINNTATVDFTNSSLTSGDSITVEAKSDGNINARANIISNGAVNGSSADLDNTVTTTNTISTDSNTKLQTTQKGADITLAAYDNMDLDVRAIADINGIAGGAGASVDNELNRNNNVSVNGTISSKQDVNLFAGKDKSGNEGKLTLNLDSEAYNSTLVPVYTSPSYENDINQNNKVSVNTGSNVSSVRDINAYADSGKESIREATITYRLYDSDNNINTFSTSSASGKTSELSSQHRNNSVDVNGTLTAGIDNKQHITIGGDSGQQVLLDPTWLEEALKVDGQGDIVGADGLIIDTSSNINKDDIKLGTMDYAVELFNRYEELNKLMDSYGDDKTSAAYLGYQSEQQYIFNKLLSMNLVEQDKDGNLTVVTNAAMIDYIEIPDIVASGGNVNIQTDNLTGSGSIKAQGSPEVTIDNNTNLYLKVNDVSAGETGGKFIYNNTALTGNSDEIKQQIGAKNQNATAPDLTVTADNSTDTGKITINDNMGGGEIKANVEYTDDSGTSSVTVYHPSISDVEINGLIDAGEGTVNIKSTEDSIIIQGKDAASSAGITGKEIHLDAGKSVQQGYQDGIVNIGGSVEEAYKDLYQNSKNEFNKTDFNKGDVTEYDVQTTTDSVTKPSGNMIVGENIYINAADININGYMQSGYGKYELTIDSTVQSQIDDIQKNWDGTALSDSSIMFDSDTNPYKLKLQQTGNDLTTKYLDAYYNPYTQKIIVPDVDANGGKIYLTGRISSTGGGSINVLDGAYDIAVKNDTNADLQLGKLVSNDVEGLISITDYNKGYKGTITEIKRNGTTTTDIATGETTSSGSLNIYNPEEDLRYNWTTGQNTTTSKTYEQKSTEKLWGAGKEHLSPEEMTQYEDESHLIGSTDGETDPKSNGTYIGFLNIGNNNKDADYIAIFDNKVLSNETVNNETRHYSEGVLNSKKVTVYSWTNTTGSAQQYIGSVKADNPISINFFGNESGNSNINVSSTGTGDIDINNKITSSSADSTIAINSAGGAINQNASTITGSNVNLTASSGINDIDITSLSNTVSLNANTDTGNVDVTVNAGYGTAGNVALNTVSTTSGNVSLTADGNITQTGNTTSVTGDRIDLTSNNGTIGTSKQRLQVHGGQTVTDYTDSMSASVNANAHGDIYIGQSDGDLRVGKIYSDTGDVDIAVDNGSLVDALPAGEYINRGDKDALVQKWKDLGLIATEKGETSRYSEKQQTALNNYNTTVENEFAQYENMKATYTNEQLKNDLVYQALDKRYGDYTSVDAYKQSTEYQDNIKGITGSAPAWTKDQLLYTIRDSLVNPTSGTADQVIKDPNIKGANIKIQTSGNVGEDTNLDTTLTLDNIKDNANNLANLSDAVYDKDTNTLTATGKKAIGVQTLLSNGENGTITVNSGGNAYITGRTENNENIQNAINIRELTANGNALVQSKDGIYDASINTTAIKANDLTLETSGDSIGTADKALTIGATGTVSANAAKDINLSQNLPGQQLYLGSVSAGEDINIKAKDYIVSTDSSHYIRSDNGNITLKSYEGSVGTAYDKVYIKNTSSQNDTQRVNITAGKDINVAGLALATDDAGSLFIGDVSIDNILGTSGGNIYIEDDGTLQIKGSVNSDKDTTLQATGDIVSDGTISAKDGSVSIDATQNLTTNGTVSAKGNISFTSGNDTALNNTVTSSNGSITANSNNFSSIGAISAENGSISVDAKQDLTTDGTVSANGDISLTSGNDTALNNTITSTNGSITANAKHDITAQQAIIANGKVNITADNDITLNTVTSNSDTILVEGKNVSADDILAKNDITITGNDGNVTLNADTTSTDGSIKVNGNDFTSNGDISAKNGSITVDAKQNLTTNGTVSAKDDISLSSGNDTALNNTVTSSTGSITANSNNFSSTGAISAKNGSVSVDAKQDLTTDGTVSANGDISFTSGNDTTLNNTITSTNGSITANAKHDITAQQAIIANNKVNITADNDIVLNTVTSNSDTILVEGKNISADDILAKNDITITGNDGDVTLNSTTTSTDGSIKVNGNDFTSDGDISAKNGSITVDAKQNLTTNGTVSAKDDISLTSGNDTALNNTVTSTNGAITSNSNNFSSAGNISAENGTISVDAKKNITTDGTVSAKDDISLISGNDTALNNTVTSSTGSITANSNNFSSTGAISAENGSISVDAKQDLTTDGTVSANGDISFTSGNDTTLNNTITSTNGSITANATHDITAQQAITANGKVNITADNDIALNTVTSNSDTILVEGKNISANDILAKNDITITGNDGNVTLNADTTSTDGSIKVNGNDLTSDGDISAKNGSITVDAKQDLTTNGTVSANGDISFTSGNDTVLNNTVTSETGSVSANAGQAFTANGNITADSKVDISAGKDATLNGSMTSNDSISVNADNVAANNDITADNIDLTADSQLNLNSGTVKADTATMQAGTNINQQSGHGISVNDLTAKAVTGVNIANSTNNLQNIKVQNTGTGDVKVGSSGLYDVNVNVLGKDNSNFIDGSVDIHNYNNHDGNLTDLTVNSSIKSTNDISITNDEADVQLNEDITSTDGSININSDDFTSDGNISAENGSVSINAQQNLTTNGTVSAKDDISLASGNDTVLNNTVTSTDGSITANSNNFSSIGNISAKNGSISIDAQQNITTDGTVSAKDDISLTSGNDTQLNNTVTSTDGSITANSKHDITAQQSITANGKVNITADNDIALNTVTSNFDTVLISGNNISADDILAKNDITITGKDGDVSLNADTTSTDGSIKVNGNNFSSVGNISAENGSISVDAKQDLTTDGTVSAKDDISFTSGNDTALNNTVTSSTGSVTANSNNFSSVGNISAENGSVSVDAKQNLTTDGTVSAKGDISFTSGNNTVLNNTVTSETSSVTANAGQAFTANGNITANSKVDISAGKDATLNGSMTSNDSVSVDADNIAANNDITADNIDLTADSQLNLNSGTLKADTATMQAGTNITQQNGHNISVNDLTARAI